MRTLARVALAAALTLIVGGRLWVHARNEIALAARARRRARAKRARETFAASRRPGGGAVVFRNPESARVAHTTPDRLGWFEVSVEGGTYADAQAAFDRLVDEHQKHDRDRGDGPVLTCAHCGHQARLIGGSGYDQEPLCHDGVRDCYTLVTNSRYGHQSYDCWCGGKVTTTLGALARATHAQDMADMAGTEGS